MKSGVPLLVVHPYTLSHGRLTFIPPLAQPAQEPLSAAELSRQSRWRGALPSAHPAGTEKLGALGAFPSWTESTQHLFAKLCRSNLRFLKKFIV